MMRPMEVDPAAEPVAVYDAAGAVAGVAPRGEVYARSLWHGASGVLVRSGDGGASTCTGVGRQARHSPGLQTAGRAG